MSVKNIAENPMDQLADPLLKSSLFFIIIILARYDQQEKYKNIANNSSTKRPLKNN